MRPNIQDYHNYLEFLKDWIQFLKDREKGFSLRKIAKEAGMASGYLPMCFSGQRKLSEKFYNKIKPFLKLTAKEERHLDLLRVIAESDDPSLRSSALSALQKFKGYREANQSELEVHKYLSNWYYVAIRELINGPGFIDDVEWIQARLRGRVTQKEVEEALHFLTNFGFVNKNSDGKYKVAEKQLDCHEGVYKISLSQFHRQMLDFAKLSIDETPRDERLLLGHTASLSADQYNRIQAILKESLTQIEIVGKNSHSESNSSANEVSVYHIELALFPLTKQTNGDSGNTGE
ncbi:MAG: DUF4423 domain-containing protein [Bdellovibrio sp.]